MATAPSNLIRGALPESVASRVRALARDAAEHDGPAPLGEQTLLQLLDPGAVAVHLVHPDAYAVVDLGAVEATGDASVELVVAPSARRRGIGTSVLAAARGAAGEAGARRALVWAHGNLPAAQALAARERMVPHRELWQMALDLSLRPALPLPPLPGGVVVRPFVVGRDEEALLAVNAAAFAQHPDQGRMTLPDLRARQREPFRADDLLLAERDSQLVGFAWLKVDSTRTGELYVLGVDPQVQRSGLGRALTARSLDLLAARGVRRAVLYTDATNEAAVRTYTWAGFRQSRVDMQYR